MLEVSQCSVSRTLIDLHNPFSLLVIPVSIVPIISIPSTVVTTGSRGFPTKSLTSPFPVSQPQSLYHSVPFLVS